MRRQMRLRRRGFALLANAIDPLGKSTRSAVGILAPISTRVRSLAAPRKLGLIPRAKRVMPAELAGIAGFANPEIRPIPFSSDATYRWHLKLKGLSSAGQTLLHDTRQIPTARSPSAAWKKQCWIASRLEWLGQLTDQAFSPCFPMMVPQ
jgi:hypothetical protein